MTRAGVLAKLKEEGFEIIGLFGSCAREQQTEASDIDILFERSGAEIYSQGLGTCLEENWSLSSR